MPFGYSTKMHGPAGLLQWFQGYVSNGSDAKTQHQRTIATAEGGVSEHIGRYTHTGPLVTPAGEVPPTGRRVEVRFAAVYQLKDGKIAQLRVYYDGATIMRQLGLIS